MDFNNKCKFSDFLFESFHNTIITDRLYELYAKKKEQGLGSIYYYFNIKYTGSIPSLYYLGYEDLLNKVIKEIIIPLYQEYNPYIEIMGKNNLKYQIVEHKCYKHAVSYYFLKDFEKDYSLNFNLDCKNKNN